MTTLSVVEFGEVLLKSGDLDPVYLAINSAGLPERTKDRLCLSYWCFYHLGAAAKMAESSSEKGFWAKMREAAAYSPKTADPRQQNWPRGAERRHYRGAQSVSSMADLAGQYESASGAVSRILGPHDRSTTFKQVSARVQIHRGFGAWIAFKIANVSSHAR